MPELLFIDTEMGKVVGGAQTFLTRLLPELERRGHTPFAMVSSSPVPSYAETLVQHGVRVVPGAWRYDRIVQDSAPRLADWVNSRRDLIYVVSVSSGIGWAAIPLLRVDVPTLAICHNDSSAFYNPIVHYADALDVVCAVSRPIQAALMARGVGNQRVIFTPYGVQSQSRRPDTDPSEPLNVAFIGRLEEGQKALTTLAEAANLNTNLPITYSIIGDGPDRSVLEHLISSVGGVDFLGSLPPPDVSKALRAADCLVLPSRYEGMPLVVLEALSHGVVPIVSDIPAHKALVTHGQDGLLFASGNAASLANALRLLYMDRELLAKLSLGAHSTSARYSVSAMADAYELAFLAAAEQRNLAPKRAPIPLLPTCRSAWPLPVRRGGAWMRQQIRRISA